MRILLTILFTPPCVTCIGTCLNRWFDKLQLIVCKDGSASMNFEHTAVDGHTVLRFAADTFADTVVRFARKCVCQLLMYRYIFVRVQACLLFDFPPLIYCNF